MHSSCITNMAGQTVFDLNNISRWFIKTASNSRWKLCTVLNLKSSQCICGPKWCCAMCDSFEILGVVLLTIFDHACRIMQSEEPVQVHCMCQLSFRLYNRYSFQHVIALNALMEILFKINVLRDSMTFKKQQAAVFLQIILKTHRYWKKALLFINLIFLYGCVNDISWTRAIFPLGLRPMFP